MKLLVVEWNAYMQYDLIEVLQKMEIPHETFSYHFMMDEIDRDDYLERNLKRVLREGDFVGVFSLNFWSPIARACHELSCLYIAWVYDCPLPGNEELMESLRYPTNRVFLFDRAQYQGYVEDGIDTVYHMPLGVNVERLDQMSLSMREIQTYDCDVSFVGSMYQSDYQALKNDLEPYEQGYIEGLIETQYRIYGMFYIKEVLTDSFILPIKERLTSKGLPCHTDDLFRRWMVGEIAREITRRERMMIISPLSRRCKFHLYSVKQEELLRDVIFRGTVDSQYDMPKVFKASRVNLNITYREITTGLPLRILDIMGAGGFLLTNYQEELVEHFRPGLDCVIYESVEDAVEKAQYYLRHEDERREIARNGHEAVKKFAMDKQLRKILDIVFPDGI